VNSGFTGDQVEPLGAAPMGKGQRATAIPNKQPDRPGLPVRISSAILRAFKMPVCPIRSIAYPMISRRIRRAVDGCPNYGSNPMRYEFSLIVREPEVTDEDADRLYEAGCDDASILTRGGVTRLQFDRHASNLDEALASAIQSVERAGLAAARVEIERHEVPQIVWVAGVDALGGPRHTSAQRKYEV
jgi:hypothetical protein